MQVLFRLELSRKCGGVEAQSLNSYIYTGDPINLIMNGGDIYEYEKTNLNTSMCICIRM